jgi:hypothetical protein
MENFYGTFMEQLFKQIVVIGGGPAGVAAAISAINSGAEDVTIIEKEPYGRHRIGEILLTQTILEFKELAITFGKQLGKIATLITQESLDAVEVLKKYELSYISELEVLNKVVTQWYSEDFSFDKNWASAAKKISKIFGREIGTDVESFRWISNLENIHHIIKDKNDITFLNEVNSIKMIHDFEKYCILTI